MPGWGYNLLVVLYRLCTAKSKKLLISSGGSLGSDKISKASNDTFIELSIEFAVLQLAMRLAFHPMTKVSLHGHLAIRVISLKDFLSEQTKLASKLCQL